jgi:hypothetical protein
MSPLWLLHFASVAFMTGLIWLIQLVHYPLMARVGEDRFKAYHLAHSTRISFIVMPVMLLELVTAALLFVQGAAMGTVYLMLTLACFASTAVFSVPCHQKLSLGFDQSAHSRLVSTNWIRTVAWTAHLGVLWLARLEVRAFSS